MRDNPIFDWKPYTTKNECPICKSKNYYPVEIDIGKYREYFCVDCTKHFFAPNPSYSNSRVNEGSNSP